MKRCPTCQKTFDDALRFCQTDGTPLVDDAPPPDPYKTMVASREDIQAALNAPAAPEPAQQSNNVRRDDEPLEIPSAPMSSPTPASEFETKLAGRDDAQVIEIPPLTDSAPPEPPRFNEPSTPPPSFGDKSAPPSPFSNPSSSGAGDFPTTPPIPSPFSGSPKPPSFEPPPPARASEPEPEQEEPTYFEPEPVEPTYSEPEPAAPQYAEPEPPPAQQFNPFQGQSAPQDAAIAQTEWTPPPTPAQGGPGMSRPPAAAAAKLNQTLPIVSLVFGIVSICCYISPLTGLVALITGFLGLKNIKNDPRQYGGKVLAIIGMVLGGLMFIVGIAYWVFILFLGGANILLQLLNR